MLDRSTRSDDPRRRVHAGLCILQRQDRDAATQGRSGRARSNRRGAAGLEHIVVTSVDRDDLPDGGAGRSSRVIEALRQTTPATTIEILPPTSAARCAPRWAICAGPDVYSHNLETVPRLYPTIGRCALLCLAAAVERSSPTRGCSPSPGSCSGSAARAARGASGDGRRALADVDFLTMGQYLQPAEAARVRPSPAGVRCRRDRPRRVPAGRLEPADTLELPRRRGLRPNALGSRSQAREAHP
jgi:hypothetical protein